MTQKTQGSLRILVLSGPNLGRLGKRQPGIYGTQTLEDIHRVLGGVAEEEGVQVECRQSNHEGDLLDWVGAAGEQGFAGIVMNPGAFTHTSYALYDAILGTELPVVEVHISNPEARENFRRHSCIAPACLGQVAGFGSLSYSWGLRGLVGHLKGQEQ